MYALNSPPIPSLRNNIDQIIKPSSNLSFCVKTIFTDKLLLSTCFFFMNMDYY